MNISGVLSGRVFKTYHDIVEEFLPLCPSFVCSASTVSACFTSSFVSSLDFLSPSLPLYVYLSSDVAARVKREWEFLKRGTDKVSVWIANRG